MTRFTLKGLAARPLRTVLTALAIVLGVAMISGALTLGDTMRSAADSLSTASYRGTDAVVTRPTAFSSDMSANVPRPVPAGVLDEVRSRPGVAVAAGDVSDEARIVGDDGKPVGSGPYFGVGFDARTPGTERLTPFRLEDGAWARGPGQVVVDAGTAEKESLAVGDTIPVATRGPARRYEITGVATFGDVKSLGTATAAIFDLEVARRLYGRDGYDSILAAGPRGTDQRAFQAGLRSAVPGLQVQSAEAQDRFTLDGLKMGVSIIKWVLLGFGIVAVLVGAFTIVNTLSITVAQRSREFALLRALGSTRRQVLRSVLLEALAVGLIASAIGVVAGLGLAEGLASVMASFGLELPMSGMVLELRTVLVAMAVGTLVTVAAGLVPARRATRVAPVSILREGAAQTRTGRIGRGVRRVIGVLGRPAARIGGSAGELARANAMRNPGRTLATAAALTIGVALVAFVAVVGHGLKQSTSGALEKRIAADYVVVGQDGWSPVDPAALKAVAAAPGVTQATGIVQDEVRAFGKRAFVAGVDPKAIGSAFRYEFTDGSPADLASLSGTGALVRSDFAARHRLKVGSAFSVTPRSGEKLALTVRAIEKKMKTDFLGLGQVTIARATFARAFETERNWISFVAFADGASPAAREAVESRLAGFPEAKAVTSAAYADESAAWLDQIMAIFYVLLALAVLVSLFGIVNTLVLSVFERTRELGMLRAIGMTRRQVRRMVRHESVITAVLGAVLGIGAGLVLALILTTALASKGLAFAVPAGSLIALVVVAIVAGIAAAVLPARRAAKLDPLTALAYE